mmetsp:Transcript_12541/g.29923  ORF Transcript_12541/g.29923 Transcript_12541/m.29923 type:complete len:368 (+) Transcript_12541:3-1106(+)
MSALSESSKGAQSHPHIHATSNHHDGVLAMAVHESARMTANLKPPTELPLPTPLPFSGLLVQYAPSQGAIRGKKRLYRILATHTDAFKQRAIFGSVKTDGGVKAEQGGEEANTVGRLYRATADEAPLSGENPPGTEEQVLASLPFHALWFKRRFQVKTEHFTVLWQVSMQQMADRGRAAHVIEVDPQQIQGRSVGGVLIKREEANANSRKWMIGTGGEGGVVAYDVDEGELEVRWPFQADSPDSDIHILIRALDGASEPPKPKPEPITPPPPPVPAAAAAAAGTGGGGGVIGSGFGLGGSDAPSRALMSMCISLSGLSAWKGHRTSSSPSSTSYATTPPSPPVPIIHFRELAFASSLLIKTPPTLLP